MQSYTKAFTLVELILVVTILGILGTIGFVSYSGYLGGARDGNRIAQAVQISDALQIYGASKTLPLPDDLIEVKNGATIIGYQGYAGQNVMQVIDYTNGGKDPKDDQYFTYYTDSSRSVYQVMTFMEEASALESFLPQTYALSYAGRFPKLLGNKLGILTKDAAGGYTPLQEDTAITTDSVDITSLSGYIAHLSDTEMIANADLVEMTPNYSCKRLKQTGVGKTSGNYTLLSGDTVSCEMQAV